MNICLDLNTAWLHTRDAILEALSPTRCVGCERPGALLCDRCRRELIRIDPLHACPRCGAPFGDLLCTECHEIEMACDRCLATAVFDGVPARMVRTYKDGGERRLADVIAELMLDTARAAEQDGGPRWDDLLSGADAATFVPATTAAFRRRGFDHMDEVARAFSALTGIPLTDTLAKRGRSDQRALGRAGRREQAQGVYQVVADVQGQRLLLLDDVITTGATVSAAAEALKRAGAATVDALALARVWG